MDFLSHLFLPLVAVYVLRGDLFERHGPWAVGLGGFGVLPDVDKFLGVPGLFHSVLTVGAVGLALVAIEHRIREVSLSPVVAGLLLSHLALDFVDGGPVLLLFPLIETGFGLQYPAQAAFGTGPVGVWIDGPLVTLRAGTPRPGFNTYGFIQGAGVASALLFGLIYAVDRSRASHEIHEN